MSVEAVTPITTLLSSLRRRASEVRRYEGRLGHHSAHAGAVARNPGPFVASGAAFLQSGVRSPSTCRDSATPTVDRC
jgi:hypothetical protein